jgi:hypothetical protein
MDVEERMSNQSGHIPAMRDAAAILINDAAFAVERKGLLCILSKKCRVAAPIQSSKPAGFAVYPGPRFTSSSSLES